MGNNNNIRLILGSLRYKSASNTDFGIKVPFIQTTKQLVEYDKNIDLDLQQLFEDERQKSTKFRPSSKFLFVFKNSYTGTSTYEPFRNNLYYVDSENDASISCTGGTSNWNGFPQYTEFDFIRTDYSATGYTQPDSSSPPNYHLKFETQSASSYNWSFYMSYAFENDYNKPLSAVLLDRGIKYTLNWTAQDGIPFVVRLSDDGGKDIVSFVSPLKHGIRVGEFVKLDFSYGTSTGPTDTFQVYSLGDGTFESDLYIFNLLNPGFLGTTFNDGTIGTAKRVIIDTNLTETTSKYYVRRNKILTNPQNAIMSKASFEQNIFRNNYKIERAVLTPNNIRRTSIKEGSQSYTLSFNEDLDLLNLIDNQKRPVSELFYTIIWKGYFGWMNDLKLGYGFNLPLDPVTKLPTSWWSSPNSDSNLSSSQYFNLAPYGTNPAGVPYQFFYVNSLQSGDTIDGDLCEWNDYEQTERVISDMYHKLTFNQNNFSVSVFVDDENYYYPGYYYRPLHPITIRAFSDYIEESESTNVEGIPNWSYFSENRNLFIWRDIYTYGYIDSDGIGVDQPFLNGKHHPFKNIIFRLIPEGTNYLLLNNVADPITDPCE
jgi:hypothetical protein